MSKKGGSTPPPPAPVVAPTVDDSAQLADNDDTNNRAQGLGQTILTSGGGASLDPTNTDKKTLLGGAGI